MRELPRLVANLWTSHYKYKNRIRRKLSRIIRSYIVIWRKILKWETVSQHWNDIIKCLRCFVLMAVIKQGAHFVVSCWITEVHLGRTLIIIKTMVSGWSPRSIPVAFVAKHVKQRAVYHQVKPKFWFPSKHISLRISLLKAFNRCMIHMTSTKPCFILFWCIIIQAKWADTTHRKNLWVVKLPLQIFRRFLQYTHPNFWIFFKDERTNSSTFFTLVTRTVAAGGGGGGITCSLPSTVSAPNLKDIHSSVTIVTIMSYLDTCQFKTTVKDGC